ncbi:hypothetical protein HK105_201766 [Polyrhizophydium stewartii]|uniref:VWFA domain-containing protein n=1 Tax=Polyrhizophydium stewartii TaxID=2732419 RepID=A0ABR4NHE4_9FUNG
MSGELAAAEAAAQSLPPPPPYEASQSFTGSQAIEKLHQIIADNRLHAWHGGEASLQAVVRRVSSVDFFELARRWRLAPVVAFDLVSLALFDVVFFVDDSGSMLQENGDRIDDLKFILSKAAEVMTLFDDDGVQVRFMNSDVAGDGICTAAQVGDLVAHARFAGMTPIGTQFKRKVLDPLVVEPARRGTLRKPVLAIIITDGEPTQEPPRTLRNVILEAKNALAHTACGPGALSIQIGQVGTDIKAQQFLAQLDNDPEVGGMIDCTSNYEMESEELMAKGVELTPELWLMKLCLGAVDRGYDNTD